MKKCIDCGKALSLGRAYTPEGVHYNYYRCSCGQMLIDRHQLRLLVENYQKLPVFVVK